MTWDFSLYYIPTTKAQQEYYAWGLAFVKLAHDKLNYLGKFFADAGQATPTPRT